MSKTNVDIGVTNVEGIQLAVSGLNLYIGPILIFCIPEVIDSAPFINTPPCLSAVTEIGPAAILAASGPASKNTDEDILFLFSFCAKCLYL